MSIKIIVNNRVCRPTKPKTAEDKASRCLKVLLEGGTINRKTLNEKDIGAKNDSAHSLISILRNQRFIPIESHRISDDTCNYYMVPREIMRYRTPELRKQQREEMKILVEQKRQEKIIENLLKLLHQLGEFPHLWRYWESLPLKLEELAREIDALLESEKGVN